MEKEKLNQHVMISVKYSTGRLYKSVKIKDIL